MNPYIAVIHRDLLIALRRKNEAMTSVIFFVVVAALFPLGISPEMSTLRLIAPGVLWIGAFFCFITGSGGCQNFGPLVDVRVAFGGDGARFGVAIRFECPRH